MISKLVIVPAPRAISHHAEVARILGIDIITGQYPEGAKLPGDAELIRLFGVSRPVLREGVKTRQRNSAHSPRPGKPAAGVAITICANRGFGKIAQVLSFITSRPSLRGHATTDTAIR